MFLLCKMDGAWACPHAALDTSTLKRGPRP